MGDDQTLPLLQLPGQPAIQFVPQVIEGGKRGKAQDLSAGFLQIGIGPKPTARPVRDELQKDLHQGLLVVGEAFFPALDEGGQVLHGHVAEAAPVDTAPVPDGVGDAPPPRCVAALDMDHDALRFVVWVSGQLKNGAHGGRDVHRAQGAVDGALVAALTHVGDDGAGAVVPLAHLCQPCQGGPGLVCPPHIDASAQKGLEGVEDDQLGVDGLNGCLYLRAGEGQPGGVGHKVAPGEVTVVCFDPPAEHRQVILYR